MEKNEVKKGRTPQKSSFEEAQAVGRITPLPEAFSEAPEVKEEVDEFEINDPQTFEREVGHAQMDGRDTLEVGEKLFNFLKKNAKTDYLTYGKPGIKVYLKGTREKLEERDNMSAIDYHEYLLKVKNKDVK